MDNIIEEVKEELCDHYCKFLDMYQHEEDSELLEEQCKICPLNKL